MGARLTEGMEQRTISQMFPGESGWTVPWAMYAETDRALYLNGNYSIHQLPGGTLEMLVKRVNGGFCVDISGCLGHRWIPTGHGFVGGCEAENVVEVIGDDG